MRAIAVVILLCLAAVLLYGCNREAAQPGTSGTEPAQPIAPGQAAAGDTAEQLVEKWKALAQTATKDNPLLEETAALASEIAIKDPHALLSLLDLVNNDQSTPYVKILATLSLTPVIGEHAAPRLIEMTKPEKEGTTRACATNMLRQILTEDVTAVLRQLKTDSEPRVRLYAQIGLAMRDPKERQEVYALYRKPETTPDEKGSIIDALSKAPAMGDLPLMQEAVAATALNEGIRVESLTVIGQIGGSDQVALLTTHSQSDPSEQVKSASKMALDALNARLAGQNQLSLPMSK